MNNTSKSKKILVSIFIFLIAIVGSTAVWFVVDDNNPIIEYFNSDDESNFTKNDDLTNNNNNQNNDNNEDNIVEEDTIETISLAVVGDIMFHSAQMQEQHFDKVSGLFNPRPYFEYVEPYFQSADLTIANFETTTGGTDLGYSGYPVFNAPDETIQALKDIGIDVLTTTNNHSLDTDDTGLIRTAKKMKEYEMDSVGTYEEKPDSRVLYKKVNNLKIAILAYTESTNGLGDQYDQDYLHSIINLMEKDIILEDIQEAKDEEADIIISYMHWGEEYEDEPNAKQVKFAEMMAEEGVHIILGSHPHVIQKSDFIETKNFDTFVIYSLGNFISNQRAETLGDDRRNTEDGVILQLELEKNMTQDELNITDINYVPTWVYREDINKKYDYRVIPIEDYINDERYKDVSERMNASLDATRQKLKTKINQ